MSRAKFTDRVGVPDLAKMPEDYRDLLVRLLTIQADCEIGGPKVYGVHWCFDAPTIDDMVRVTGIVHQKLKHFRIFNSILQSLGADQTELLRRPASERAVDAFRQPDSAEWADVAAFCCLIDRVGKFQVGELVDSSFLPLDEVLPQIIQEEQGHTRYGERQLSLLAASPETRKAAQTAVFRWYPRALDMFGRTGSARAERYVELGLKKRLNEEARRDYVDEVKPLLEEMSLEVPDEAFDRRYL